ncbi:MAG TPA: ABC transporter permease [Dehalococcoidia bacterium]|nr:ABC transporter permease [Dehalococcoidia bacterium]
MSEIRDAGVVVRAGLARRPPPRALSRLLRFVRQKPLGTAGAVILALTVASAIFASQLAGYDPNAMSIDLLKAPSLGHPLGTDNMGRDIFSRVLYGARTSLLVGFVATVMGTGTGALIGLTTAYWGRGWDLAAQRFMDMLWAFPTLIIAMVMMMVLGTSLRNVIIAISIVILPTSARIVRSQVLKVKEMEYVTAAQALGASGWRILFRHIAPNCMAPYIIVVSATLGGTIVTEASLSFLGLGVPPPTPSWGRDLFATGQTYSELAPWMPIAPGLALSFVVYGFNLLGDAIRDVLDPRLRGS